MKALLSTLTTLLMAVSINANATVMLTSENPAQAPGVATYLGDFPTPFSDPASVIGVPVAQTVFDVGSDIRAAFMLDLDMLDQTQDEGAGGYLNGLLDLEFYWFNGGDLVWQNYNPYTWLQIEDWQADFDVLSVWSDTSLFDAGLVTSGEWTVVAAVEGAVVGGQQFSVPEPASYALALFGLLAIFGRKTRNTFFAK
ncbi:PEP-CTERM sorting domain-containing protein [Agarivorans sp. DSG3-1]|uniref:PEP-CTERM sorting domain-containing protein n=1 Tax=Agarivorans sp. DSG3-1 TaxID=3342249 RepID=UPI00398F595E